MELNVRIYQERVIYTTIDVSENYTEEEFQNAVDDAILTCGWEEVIDQYAEVIPNLF